MLALLDPRDQYMQIYVPVGRPRPRARRPTRCHRARQRARARACRRRDQLHCRPRQLHAREDRDRDDRLGQVYRAKVKILEGVERFRPGTEGNVYLGGGRRGARRERPPASIRVRGLRKRFGSRTALAGIDLELVGRAARRRGRAGRRRQDHPAARAGRAARGGGRRGARARPRPQRRRARAEGADRLRAAGVQPAARAVGDGESALHRPAAPARQRRVFERRAGGVAGAHRPGAVRRPTGRRAVRRA